MDSKRVRSIRERVLYGIGLVAAAWIFFGLVLLVVDLVYKINGFAY